jgi:hypothetical protein
VRVFSWLSAAWEELSPATPAKLSMASHLRCNHQLADIECRVEHRGKLGQARQGLAAAHGSPYTTGQTALLAFTAKQGLHLMMARIQADSPEGRINHGFPSSSCKKQPSRYSNRPVICLA